jgi:ParB family chromosome partitioning protein
VAVGQKGHARAPVRSGGATPEWEGDDITEEVDIAAIVVGERHRKDMGDIGALARSIADIGLLHPLVVAPNLRLIAGERRLRACQSLGWHTVPITVIDLDEIVRGEHAENAHRKDFTLSEAVAIKRAL